MDRRLVSTPELLHVSAVKPHEVTFRFAVPFNPGTPELATNIHTALAAGMAGSVSPRTNSPIPTSPLYRALELLTVKPWTFNTPEGARVAGRINANMIWDKRVLESLLNPSGSNNFTTAEVDAIWDTMFKEVSAGSSVVARSKGLAPTTTFDELPATATAAEIAGCDRPFKSFGSPLLTNSTNTPLGSNIDATLLRTAGLAGTNPVVFLPDTATRTHPYQKAEALQKAFNNLTTVSDTYLVLYTVGFFEVRNPPSTVAGQPQYGLNNPPVLGAEMYSNTPGDLRTQFAAVVDRTHLSRPVIGAVAAALTSGSTPTLTVNATAPSSGVSTTIAYGRTYTIDVNTRVMIGEGANAEVVSINAPTAANSITVATTTPLTKAHSPGEPISLVDSQGPPFWATEAVGKAPGDPQAGRITTGDTTLRINATRLQAGATPQVVVRYEGEDITIGPGTVLKIGTGAGSEWVTVAAAPAPAFDPITGVATISLQSALLRDHHAGDAVTGVVPGNPGPQPNFAPDPGNTKSPYKSVVPFFSQITP